MTFPRVSTGDPVAITQTALIENAKLRAAELALSDPGRIGEPRPSHTATTALVWNNTDAAVDRGGFIRAFNPVDSENLDNDSRLRLVGSEYDETNITSRVAVPLKHLGPGEIGPCVVDGPVHIKVDITDVTHTHAHPDPDDPAGPWLSNLWGHARILWPSSYEVETQWVIAEIAPLGSRPLRLVIEDASTDVLNDSIKGSLAKPSGGLYYTDVVYCARPHRLHVTAANLGPRVTTVSEVIDAQTIVVGGVNLADVPTAERWIVTPTYESGDHIFAIAAAGSDFQQASSYVRLLDLNVDGRAWAKMEDQTLSWSGD